ncbi:FAD binding domain-containing protein [Paenibacillus aceris]|uniref:Xanthine dehydrogenase molybdenum-binding subunit n=1 Tax=Paenibacillus aceris TaxID=869555 RepID=A0ABS4I0L8_9BACL|nr:FAD binding domain-containing protein [Paenibacillus aceris]MBP1964106.1 xanthine dehydrogenase molybdenum-binding subunit [Paenibacillus aceris]
MIPFDLEYYKPTTVQKAVELFQSLQMQGKNPLYFSGGTEIITFARRRFIHPGAVVDLKAIPESNVTELQKNGLVIGCCVSLTNITETNLFPLLSEAVKGVADQTARNKITLGGNICGEIYYREAVLPLLLTDSRMVIAGLQGIKVINIHHVFSQWMRLEKNEFLLQTITDREYLSLPYIHFKKRQIGTVGYPLVTVAALKKDKQIRLAFSGVCAFPFRSIDLEQIVNNSSLSLAERIDQIIWNLPAPVLNNTEGTADYRTFVLKNTLFDTVKMLEGM